MLIADFAASFGRLVADHLWQSTGVAALAALLASALRGNRASVRHWLWLAASIKFLIPLSVLASIGVAIGRWILPVAPVSRLPVFMEQIVQPFAPIRVVGLSVAPMVQPPATHGPFAPLLLALWCCGFVTVAILGWLRWCRVAEAVRSSMPIQAGRELEVLRRIQGSGSRVRLVSSMAKLEPGTFGIFRPVLWLPAGIADRLDDAELEAILTHELCHIRRRDNLTALIAMAVEAIFWFHPLVWWLGARLTEERERACDEEVVRMGGQPQVYAESILKVCEFYLASPVACAAGVTGGELEKRIESIMTNRLARNLSPGKKLMLAAAAVAAVIVPFAFGVASARAQTPRRPSLDVVSVKINHNGQMGGSADFFPVNGTWTAKALAIPGIIAYAYDVSWNRVEGVPKALRGPDPGFDIVAKVPLNTTRKEFRLMMQSLLIDRFKAVIHTEVRDIAANTIEVAKGGVKLPPASGQCVELEESAPVPASQHRCHEIVVRVGVSPDQTVTTEYSGWSVSMPELAAKLSNNGLVVDATGLSGLYDFNVKVETRPVQDEFDRQGNWHYAVRTAWEKQAGLLIDLSKTKKRSGVVVVVDHIELSTPN